MVFYLAGLLGTFWKDCWELLGKIIENCFNIIVENCLSEIVRNYFVGMVGNYLAGLLRTVLVKLQGTIWRDNWELFRHNC
jgi:hypothetical protein